jgi:hypothetical protein
MGVGGCCRHRLCTIGKTTTSLRPATNRAAGSKRGERVREQRFCPRFYQQKQGQPPRKTINGWHRPPSSGRGGAPQKPLADLIARRRLASPVPRDRNAPGKAALFFADFLLGGMKRKPGGVRGAAPAVVVLVSCLRSIVHQNRDFAGPGRSPCCWSLVHNQETDSYPSRLWASDVGFEGILTSSRRCVVA